MKLAFTTLACPDWGLDKILEAAISAGYDGVDFRGMRGEMDLWKLPEFSIDLDKTVTRIEDAGLVVPAISSSIRLVVKDEDEAAAALAEAEHYARICQAFGAEYIRVFGGSCGEMERDVAVNVAAATLWQLSETVTQYGAKIVVETHDDWVESRQLARIMDAANTDAGVLWDVHHPYRMKGESPEETWKILGDRICYTHFKDSYKTEDGYQLCLTGDGDIPLLEIIRQLKVSDYDGWLTFEWEKKWHPEIAGPEMALPQYVEAIRQLINSL